MQNKIYIYIGPYIICFSLCPFWGFVNNTLVYRMSCLPFSDLKKRKKNTITLLVGLDRLTLIVFNKIYIMRVIYGKILQQKFTHKKTFVLPYVYWSKASSILKKKKKKKKVDQNQKSNTVVACHQTWWCLNLSVTLQENNRWMIFTCTLSKGAGHF